MKSKSAASAHDERAASESRKNALRAKRWRWKNRERVREYRRRHRERYARALRKWRVRHPARDRAQRLRYLLKIRREVEALDAPAARGLSYADRVRLVRALRAKRREERTDGFTPVPLTIRGPEGAAERTSESAAMC